MNVSEASESRARLASRTSRTSVSAGMRPRRASTAIERVMRSPANYWFMLVADLAGGLGILGLGVRLFHGPVTGALAALAVGCLAWGWIEYAVHRWVLHGSRSSFQRAHARHHRDATALVSAPLFLSTGLAVALWGALCLLLAPGTAALAVAGTYAGYNYYALLHHVQHHHPAVVARVAWLARLDRAHREHHRRYRVNFGVTSLWWDQIHGTRSH
jgi:sterol desaturase/sphingolipid hydroxylase (fatty acid hydroxylase superfamily)